MYINLNIDKNLFFLFFIFKTFNFAPNVSFIIYIYVFVMLFDTFSE